MTSTGGHEHGHGSGSALRLSFVLTVIILVVEVTAGIVSHSLALLSDAGHILTDVVALGLAWFAVNQANRPADPRRTYGYHRVGILVAMANGVTLVLIAGLILYEAVLRLAHPEPIEGGLVIVAAMAAIVVNAFIGLQLRGQSGENLNIRAALLHVTSDLAASVGVVIAAAVVLSTGWLYADPLISVAIALLVAWGAFRIVRDTVNILLEGVPKSLDLGAVQSALAGADEVRSLHDLHVWALAPDHLALSCHVVVGEQSLADAEHLMRDLEQRVCGEFGISHTTVQLEMCCPCPDTDGHGPGDHNHPHP